MGQEGQRTWSSRHWFVIGLAAILFLSAAMRLYQIDGFSNDYDEGVYLMTTWLQARGLHLYTEILAVQPPLLYQPAAWLFALGGPSSAAARSLEVGYALLGIAAVAGAGRLLGRPAVGLVAALLLSLSKVYFIHSRLFVGSVSSAAVGAVAALCALYFQATGRRRWLLLGGAFLSFSLLIKPLSIPVGLLLVWAIVARRRGELPAEVTGRQVLRSFPWRATLLDCLYVGAAGLVLPILCFVLYDGPAMLRLLISIQSTRLSGREENWVMDLLSNYVRYNLPVLLLAGLGIIQTIRRRNGLGVTVIVWLVLNFIFVVVTQAQKHHLAVLDLPLALLAAQPVGDLIDLVRTRRWRPRPWNSLPAALLLAYYLVALPALLTKDFAERPRGSDWPENKQRQEAVRLLQQATAPDQRIISDDQELVFEARRMAIPMLVDPSGVVLGSGVLTEQTFMQSADQKASALVFWSGRFADAFRILPVWARWAYTGSQDFGEGRVVYYNKQSPHITHPLNLAFGGEIGVAGYDLGPAKPPKMTLYWKRLNPQAGNRTVTLRLLDTSGAVVAQRDGRPYDGRFPTSAWPVDVLLPEEVTLPPTDALPPGEYRLAIGIYATDGRELLPLVGGAGQDNLALLEALTLGNR